MRISLVYPRIRYSAKFELVGYEKNMSGYPPLSLAYVAGIIKRAGHEVNIIDGNILNLSFARTMSRIVEFSPDILGFHVTTPTFQSVLQWIRKIKRVSNIPVLVGGPLVSIYPHALMFYKEIDFALAGSAVVSLPEFLQRYENKRGFFGIDGLCFRNDGEVVINEPTGIAEMSLLPRPSRELLPVEKYYSPFSSRKNFTPFLSYKGCAFKCSHCCLSENLQMRDPQDVLGELEECFFRHNVRNIDFYDTVFTLDKERVLQLCRKIRRKGLNFIWTARTRIELIDEDLLGEMAAAGCRMLMYGIEAIDAAVLKKLKRPLIPEEKLRQKIIMTKKAGISTFGFFMMGCPGDTKRTMEKRIEIARHLGLDFAQFSRLIAIPDTELYDAHLKKGGHDYWREIILDNRPEYAPEPAETKLTSGEIARFIRKANIRFYLNPGQLLKIILVVSSPFQLLRFIKAAVHMCISCVAGSLWGKYPEGYEQQDL